MLACCRRARATAYNETMEISCRVLPLIILLLLFRPHRRHAIAAVPKTSTLYIPASVFVQRIFPLARKLGEAHMHTPTGVSRLTMRKVTTGNCPSLCCL